MPMVSEMRYSTCTVPYICCLQSVSFIKLSFSLVAQNAPVLQQFGMNLQQVPGMIGFGFDIAVDPDSCNPSEVTLKSSSDGTGSEFTLTGGSCIDSGGLILLSLTAEDRQGIDDDTSLATSIDNTFVTLGGQFIVSTGGGVPNAAVDTPVQAFFFEGGGAPPAGLTIDFSLLDLNVGFLTLGFTADIITLNPIGINISNAVLNTTVLISGEFMSLEQPTNSINITLTQANLNSLKIAFGSSINFTAWSVSIGPNVASTSDGTANTPTTIQLTSAVPDTTPPTFQALGLNMNASTALITFEEPIDIAAVDLSAVFLVNRISPPFSTNYSLTDSMLSASQDFTMVSVTFSSNLANQLKANPLIATAMDNSLFFFQEVSFSDFGANILPVMLRASTIDFFTPDGTPPSLMSFSVSLDSGTMDMTFDEPLDQSFNITGITFLSGSMSLIFDSQVSSVNYSSFFTTVNIQFSTIQVNEIKLLLFNTSSSNVSIAMSSSTCNDTTGNPVTPIPLSDPLTVSSISGDQMHPFLVSFSPTQRPPDAYSLSFTFNEYMDSGSFDPNSLILTLTSSVYGTNVFSSFSGGTLTNVDYFTFNYSFDLSSLSSNFPIAYQIAYYTGNMSVTFGSDFISDLSGRIVITPNPPPVVSSNETDTAVPPSLQSFSLDLAQGVIQLTFSEEVVLLEGSATSLTLQDNSNGANTFSFSAATYGNLQGLSGSIISINIDSSDLQSLLSNNAIGTSTDNTFLVISQSLAIDYSGNMITNSAPIQAASVTIPSTSSATAAPSTTRVASSSIMSTSSAVLTSSSSVAATSSSSVAVSTTAIPSTTDMPTSTIAPTSTVTSVMATTTAVISSTEAASSTAVSSTAVSSTAVSSTAVSSTAVSSTAVSSTVEASSTEAMSATSATLAVSSTPVSSTADVSSTTVIATTVSASSIAPSSTTVAASSTPAPSSTPVVITDSILDMNNGIMNMTTSRDIQVILVANNLVITNGTSSYTLTSVSSYNRITGTEFMITIGSLDLNSLKVLEPSLNWSLTIQPNAVFDITGGTNVLQTVPFSEFIADMTPPLLLSFLIDMNSETITLSFDEPIIDINVASGVYLTNSSVSNTPSSYQLSLMLQSSTIDSMTFALTPLDLNMLKFDSTIATSVLNSFIFLAQSSFEDYSSNPIESVSTQASSVTQDFTQPELVSYQIDLNSASMTLTFNEPVIISSINSNGAIISGFSPITSSASIAASLIGGSVYDTIISVSINSNINEIKLALYGGSTAYISVPSSFITDAAGNGLSVINMLSPLEVSQIFQDTTSPSVTGFSPNASSPIAGSISFIFDEYVDINSLSESSITITINSSIINGTYHMFSGGTWSSAPTNATVIYSFSSGDREQQLFGIGLLLAVNSGQVSTTFTTALATDLAGNIVNNQVSPLTYSAVVQDNVRPQFESFTIDLDAGELTLSFSEDVILVAINGNVQIQSSSINPSDVFTLNTAAYSNQTGLYGTIITIRLTTLDSGLLFNDTNLANSVNDTYLSLLEAFGVDYSSNSLIATTDGIKASQVITSLTPDNPPLLQDATLDLNSNMLLLTFNMAMNPSLTAPDLITIAPIGVSLNPGTSVVLFNGNDTILLLSLTPSDSANIKYSFTAGMSVSLGPNSVYSSEGEGSLIQSVTIETIIADTTGPLVSTYSFDLDSGQISITFNEPVSNSTYNTSNVWLSNVNSTQPTGLSLANGTVASSSVSNTILTIQLPTPIITAITSDPNLATSTANTFLFFTADSFQDLFSNPLQLSPSSIRPSSFVGDTTDPSLQTFTIDLNTGILSLSFSEVMIVSSFDISQVTLSLSSNNLVITHYNTVNTGYNSVISIEVQGSSLNQLKALINGGASVSLRMTSSAAMDASSNPVTSVSTPLGSSMVFPDTTSPSLVSLSASTVDQRTLNITFTEYILPSSFNPAGITLYLNTSTGIYTFSDFTQGATTSGVSSNLTFIFSEAEFQGVVGIRYQQAYYSGSIGISLAPTAITDIGSNDVTQSAIYYFSMLTDPVSPQLVSFQLNLDTANLTMTFSEPVVINQIQQQVTIQNAATDPTESYTLTSSGYDNQEGAIGTTVSLILSLGDVISIAGNPSLGSSVSNTYLLLGNSVAVDFSGNFLQTQASSIQASSVVDYSGQLNPQVRTFDLDLDSDQMTLHFTAPVNVSTLVASRITLLNDTSNPITSISLTNVTLIAQGEQTDFRFLLNTHDIINIKRHPLCYTASNCYGTFAQGLVLNSIQLPSAPTSSIQVSTLVQDVTPPRFLAFPVFDLNSGLFTIIFSEPINGSSAQFTQVTFSNSVNNPSQSITLNEGFTSPDSIEIDFYLTRSDLNALKYRLNLCTDRTNCWVALPSFFISDIGSNPYLHSNYQPGAIASYHQPTVFVPDTTSPSLERFSIDMNTGQITLSFDEVVDEMFFEANDVTLFNATGLNHLSITLSNDTQFIRINEGTEIILTLTTDDLNWIKARDILDEIDNSFLSLVTLMSDVSGNVLEDAVGVQAWSFIRDQSSVNLIQFSSFDLDAGTFVLSFDEPVNPQTFNLTALVFSSGRSGSPVTYRLTGGILASSDEEKLSFQFQFIVSDRIAIKLLPGLTTNEANTYLYTDPRLVADTSVNYNGPVPITSALRVSSGGFIPDTSLAELDYSELDMNTGSLKLVFNDVISASSVMPFLISIQSTPSINDGSKHTLSTSSVTSTQSSNVIFVYLQKTDLDSIKANLDLATQSSTSYVSFPTTAAQDIEGRNVIGVANTGAQRVSVYTSDTTQPQLQSYTIDMDSGTLALTLSEPVLLQSYTPQELTIQNTVSSPSSLFTLTSGTVSAANNIADSIITLTVDYDDINEIKSLTSLATDISSTFLTARSSFFTDTSSNMLVNATGLPPSSFSGDVTLPVLVSFSLDLRASGQLALNFSEAVRYTSSLQSTIMLQNRVTNPTVVISLNSGETATKTKLDEVTITLSSSHTNQLLTDSDIAETTSSLYISMTPGGIYDYSNVQGQTIASLTQKATYLCKYIRLLLLPCDSLLLNSLFYFRSYVF